MKAQVLAIMAAVALFSGISHADSACAAGLFANLLGTACNIGDKTFTFAGVANQGYFTNDPSILNTLFFTPESTLTSSGFNLRGFPGTTGDQLEDFTDYFTAVPSSGTIPSYTATLNGVSQDSMTSEQEALAQLTPSFVLGAADDFYDSTLGVTTEFQQTGFPGAAFDGRFTLENGILSGTGGSSSFDSATFVFNESNTTTVPEGSELAMLGITAVGIFGALRRKSLTSFS